MTQKTAAIAQEVMAVIGLGLFAVGVWMVYPPACLILTGLTLTAPFIHSIRKPRSVPDAP